MRSTNMALLIYSLHETLDRVDHANIARFLEYGSNYNGVVLGHFKCVYNDEHNKYGTQNSCRYLPPLYDSNEESETIDLKDSDNKSLRYLEKNQKNEINIAQET